VLEADGTRAAPRAQSNEGHAVAAVDGAAAEIDGQIERELRAGFCPGVCQLLDVFTDQGVPTNSHHGDLPVLQQAGAWPLKELSAAPVADLLPVD
jgi:hypothetical protein